MSLHDELIADQGAPTLFDQHAESVTYHPEGGSDKTIRAIITSESRGPDSSGVGRSTAKQVKAQIARSDVASPNINADQITVPGAYFGQPNDYQATVRNIDREASNSGYWMLAIN